MNSPHLIELLETRIAPAAVLTFTDLDGDLVKISVSKGTLAELQAAAGDLSDHRLQTLDLSGTADFDGASILIVATPQHGKGDGLVNVGRINATGRVLGSVVVKGDLGVIDAGATSINPVAVQSLTVESIGEYRLDTGAPDLNSDLAGSVESIVVRGDVRDAMISITGQDQQEDPVTHTHRLSSLGALSIGGSLLANNATDLGSISVVGNIGSIKIGGSVSAGAAEGSAQIGSVNGSIGSIAIGGDLIGGTGGYSGYIYASQDIGNVFVGGDVRGSGATADSRGNSGLIMADGGSVGNVTIGGSLIGGVGNYCGAIVASSVFSAVGTMGAVTIGHSVIGGSGPKTGYVYAEGGLGTVSIGGDLLGGTAAGSGFLQTGEGNILSVSVHGSIVGGSADYTGSIAAAPFGTTGPGKLGPVVVGGQVAGGSAAGATHSGLIDALGNIASVAIGGSLVGGGDSDSGLINSSASLGTIHIGGDVQGGGGLRTGRIYAGTNIGSIFIGGSLVGASSNLSGSIEIGDKNVPASGERVGAITIGGSILGGGGTQSGGIYTGQNNDDFFGPIKVGGDLKGGDGGSSGRLEPSHVTSIFIGGSLIGGAADYTGYFSPLTCGSVTVEGDIVGGTISEAGVVGAQQLGTLTIGGSVIGGTAQEAGSVLCSSISSAVIRHDLRGGTSANEDVGECGCVYAGHLGSIFVGGSLIAGQQTGSGHLTGSGSIIGGALGRIVIAGSIVGNAASQVEILASGGGLPQSDVAVQSITVGGRVEFALIAAGLNSDLTANNADAQIGSVKVGGDWVASSLIAGIDPTNGQVGDGNDVKLGSGARDDANAFSKIASITIAGQVVGKPGDTSVTYGFGAEEIGVFRVNGVALPLKPGRFNDSFAGAGAAGNALPVGSSAGTVVNDGFAVHVFEVA